MTEQPHTGLGAIGALALAVTTTISMTAGTASAQVPSSGVDTIKWDFNQFNWSTATGALLTEDFTGTLIFEMSLHAVMQDLEGGDDLLGAFQVIGEPGLLTEISGELAFTGGQVDTGFLDWANDTGDTGSASFAGSPGVLTEAPAGFLSVSGLVSEAFLSDPSGDSTFGQIQLPTIFGGPSEFGSQALIGDFVFQRMEIGASSGTVDAEIVLTVPTPGAAALLAVGAAVSTRRRR